MSDFWHVVAQVGGFLAQGMANLVDSGHRNIERRLENGEYEKVTAEQMEAYINYNPESTASLRAAGERWSEWGRGERD